MNDHTITMSGARSDSGRAMDDMKLVSVQIGRPRNVQWHGKLVSTGIYKEPVAGRIMVHRLNLDGDQQADLTVHGGPDKAVYVYPIGRRSLNGAASLSVSSERISRSRRCWKRRCTSATYFELGMCSSKSPNRGSPATSWASRWARCNFPSGSGQWPHRILLARHRRRGGWCRRLD
jgi:hypothetical protein